MSWPVVTQPEPLGFSSDYAEWGSGICDCCDDMRECCFAFWCCPCFACKTSKQYGHCLCLPLLDVCGFGCVHPLTMSMRVYVRHRYGIKGSLFSVYLSVVCSGQSVQCVLGRLWLSKILDPKLLPMMLPSGSLCRDCLCASFCPPCVWCQMSREMKKRKLPTTLGDIIHH